MLRTFLRPEIHRAMVTGSDLNYAGSLTLSPELLEAADIGVHELVQVVNSNNGAQFETYATLTDSELDGYQPQIVHVDGQNRIIDPAAAPAGAAASAAGVFRPARAGESNEVWIGREVT